MFELSPQQLKILERLVTAGFQPIAIPPYESALCIHRKECAAVLAAVDGAGLKLLAPPSILIEGNFGVRLKRPGGEVFVWKQAEVPATPERLRDLEQFRSELLEILELPQAQ